MSEEWYDSRDNLLKLAQWIVYNDGSGALDVMYFLEKPWKWNEEWANMNSEKKHCILSIDDFAKFNRLRILADADQDETYNTPDGLNYKIFYKDLAYRYEFQVDKSAIKADGSVWVHD